MTELITFDQANKLMLGAIVIIPLIGLAWGFAVKKVKTGLIWGLIIGIGNFALWKVYNANTDSLGLDTVKNLLVNLGLFVAVGVIGGMVAGLASRRRPGGEQADGSGGAPVAVGAGPSVRGSSDSRAIDDAKQPPRDAG
jgi:hypothetical protein